MNSARMMMIGSGMPISQRRAPLPKPMLFSCVDPYPHNRMVFTRFRDGDRDSASCLTIVSTIRVGCRQWFSRGRFSTKPRERRSRQGNGTLSHGRGSALAHDDACVWEYDHELAHSYHHS